MNKHRKSVELLVPGLNFLMDKNDLSSKLIEKTIGTLRECADHIERLERELQWEKESREVAAKKAWEFADRIKMLEASLEHIQKHTNDDWAADEAREALKEEDAQP